MAARKLTDREWWLMRRIYRNTLMAVLDGCEETGKPGKIVASRMLRNAPEKGSPNLRTLCEVFLAAYKPAAKARAKGAGDG